MSENYLSENQNPTRKNLSLDEEGVFNTMTNDYVNNLATLDPVLAGIMKIEILNVFGSNDYQTFEGTRENLNDDLNNQLPKNPQPTGFVIYKPVSARLASWLNIEANSMLGGAELTRLVWQQLRKRDLSYQEDRRVFRVDQESAELFGLNMEVVNASISYEDLDGFNFRNLQKHIKYANTLN